MTSEHPTGPESGPLAAWSAASPQDFEASLRALFRSAHDALVVITPDGTIVDASDSMQAVFGWEPEELRGQNVRILMPEPHRSRHDEYLRHYARTGETEILDSTRSFEVVHKSGETFTAELSVSRADAPGGHVLFLGSFRDVTERDRARAALADSEARFRAVFEQEFQFVGIAKPNGVLVEVNRAALQVANVQREDAVGHPLWRGPWLAHSPEGRETIRTAIARAVTGDTKQFELEIASGPRERRLLDFSIKPLLDEAGGVQLLICEGRDVTSLRQSQRRETAMLRALAGIGASASLLAHEIKNPITAVNMALRAVATKLGQDERTALEDLSGRLQRLERTMRRTLSFAKPLDLRPEPVPPHELLEEVARTLEPEATAKGIELVVEEVVENGTVQVDRELLEEALLNLVRNAIDALEAQGEGGTVRLRASQENASLHLEVEDDGPGIPEAMRSTLFEPFHTTKADGTGLGLPLVRKIVEEHGGTVECLPCEGSGALFHASLPCQSTARILEGPSTRPEDALRTGT